MRASPDRWCSRAAKIRPPRRSLAHCCRRCWLSWPACWVRDWPRWCRRPVPRRWACRCRRRCRTARFRTPMRWDGPRRRCRWRWSRRSHRRLSWTYLPKSWARPRQNCHRYRRHGTPRRRSLCPYWATRATRWQQDHRGRRVRSRTVTSRRWPMHRRRRSRRLCCCATGAGRPQPCQRQIRRPWDCRSPRPGRWAGCRRRCHWCGPRRQSPARWCGRWRRRSSLARCRAYSCRRWP